MVAPARKPRGRVYRGASTDERRSERRRKLIDAGVAVFGEVGYHAASVRAICAEAGLTERYFYESFENSEALLCAAYEHVVGQLGQHVLQALERCCAAPADELARTALTAYYRFLQKQPRAARILLIEVLGVSERADRLYRRATADFTALLRRVTQSLHPQRLPDGLDDELLSTGLIGAVILIASQWVLGGCRQPLAAVVENSLAIFNAVNREVFGVPATRT